MVGQGVSYTEAARRTRVINHKTTLAVGAQLVANWVEVLGPVASAEHRERAWPETVVLDSTNFIVTNTRTGERTQAFTVLAAYGYERGQRSGRLWALAAKHQRNQKRWEELLRSLPGEPSLVVSDDDAAIHNAVAAVWPSAFLKFWEHHLYQNARKRMKDYGLTGRASEGMELLKKAFTSRAAWRKFRRFARDYINLDAWAQSVDATVLDQAGRRARLARPPLNGGPGPSSGQGAGVYGAAGVLPPQRRAHQPPARACAPAPQLGR